VDGGLHEEVGEEEEAEHCGDEAHVLVVVLRDGGKILASHIIIDTSLAYKLTISTNPPYPSQ
jgi:hypothetical protein